MEKWVQKTVTSLSASVQLGIFPPTEEAPVENRVEYRFAFWMEKGIELAECGAPGEGYCSATKAQADTAIQTHRHTATLFMYAFLWVRINACFKRDRSFYGEWFVSVGAFLILRYSRHLDLWNGRCSGKSCVKCNKLSSFKNVGGSSVSVLFNWNEFYVPGQFFFHKGNSANFPIYDSLTFIALT